MEVKDKIPALDTQLEYISESKQKLLLTIFKVFKINFLFPWYHMLLKAYKLFSNLFKL